MRPLKLGLSRPKSKKKVTIPEPDHESEKIDDNVPDEINASRETIESISNLHLRKSVKAEPQSILETDESSQMSTESITDLVNKVNVKYENIKLHKSVLYDKQNQFEPVAGPSNLQTKTDPNCDVKDEFNNDTLNSSTENNDLGFISFYDTSKIFDISARDDNQDETIEIANDQIHYGKECLSNDLHELKVEEKLNCSSSESEEDMKLHYSETLQTIVENKTQVKSPSKTKPLLILTPKFRPPTKSYVLANLDKYNIHKVKNKQPFYSDHKDGGDKVEIGSLMIKVQSKAAQDQKPLEKVLNTTSIEEWRQLFFLQINELSENTKLENLKTLLAGNIQCILEPLKKPPTFKEVVKWINDKSKQESEEQNKSIENNEITNNLDELENSQVIGLNEINSSVSLETDDKVSKVLMCKLKK